jgi:hypothetical protein
VRGEIAPVRKREATFAALRSHLGRARACLPGILAGRRRRRRWGRWASRRQCEAALLEHARLRLRERTGAAQRAQLPIVREGCGCPAQELECHGRTVLVYHDCLSDARSLDDRAHHVACGVEHADCAAEVRREHLHVDQGGARAQVEHDFEPRRGCDGCQLRNCQQADAFHGVASRPVHVSRAC